MALSAIFNLPDMEVCNLPLPTGYPLSWTHSGICYAQNGINGFKYLLTSSPYPLAADEWENPMFHYANERAGGLPPINFTAYANNPLQQDPPTPLGGTAYNADPDILLFNSELYITNRPYNTRFPSGVGSGYYQRTWVNAQKAVINAGEFSFTAPVDLFDNYSNNYFGYTSITPTLVSPSFIQIGSKVRSYHLITNSYNDASRCRKMVIMEGNNLTDANNFQFLKFGSIYGKNIEPWHLDIFEHGGKLYAIVNGVDMSEASPAQKAKQYLAVSDDFENFRIFPRPLVSQKSYRGSACVREDGLFVLYNAIIGQFLPGQPSIDGRDIILSYRPFSEVLSQVQV